MINYYILVGKKLKKVDRMTWSRWFEDSNSSRYVALTKGRKHKYMVSTVCLGFDHSFGFGDKLFFETMVFDSGTEMDNEPYRWTTYDQAVTGHKNTVKALRKLLSNKK